MPFSLFPHAARKVLAVKGSLRRALPRALDCSGPFCKTFPTKRKKGRSRTGAIQSNGLPLIRMPPPRRLSGHGGWMPRQLLHGTQFCGEIFLLTSPFIERLTTSSRSTPLFDLGGAPFSRQPSLVSVRCCSSNTDCVLCPEICIAILGVVRAVGGRRPAPGIPCGRCFLPDWGYAARGSAVEDRSWPPDGARFTMFS
jgi:hypothetical protein